MYNDSKTPLELQQRIQDNWFMLACVLCGLAGWLIP